MDDLWAKIAADIGKSPVVAAWFTAGGALIAALVSALVSYLVARRAVYINAVTVERSKWIEALRATISSYSGIAGKISARRDQDSRYARGEEWAKDTETLRRLLSDLTLRLNPTESEALNLLRIAEKLDQAARVHRPGEFLLANQMMILHAQWVTKAEWDRVKQEASGWTAGPLFIWKNWLRRRRYRAFLRSSGSLHRLDLIGAGQPEIISTLARSEMTLTTDPQPDRPLPRAIRTWFKRCDR